MRIDHNFTSKLSIFGHFISEQVSQGFGVSQWSGAKVPTVGDTFSNPSYSAVVHATYTIGCGYFWTTHKRPKMSRIAR